MTHDIFQPGLFVFIVHTRPVYLDQRWQNQQHCADRDLQNSDRRHDCAQTCSSCSSPRPPCFFHRIVPASPSSHRVLSASQAPHQPPVVFLESGTMKSKFPWQDRQQEMGGRRCTGIASSCCPAHDVPAPLSPPDSAATTGFSASHSHLLVMIYGMRRPPECIPH